MTWISHWGLATTDRRRASRRRPKARNSRRNGEHIADQVANSAITGPPVLISAAGLGYRPPKMSGCARHMGNVDRIEQSASFWRRVESAIETVLLVPPVGERRTRPEKFASMCGIMTG